MENTLGGLIKCEEQNGKFYYIVVGRLVGIRDQQLSISMSNYSLCRELELRCLGSLRLCPKFKTKTQKRDGLLKDLGI